MSDWISVRKQKPFCWETGDWDGKRSDRVLCIDINDIQHIGIVYRGFLDGTEFFEWYDKIDFEIKDEITHWMPLPEPPKTKEA